MSLYTIVLFLHVVGALGLFIAMGLEWISLPRLRRAASIGEVRTWLGVFGLLRRIGGPSALTLLASGIYLTATAWRETAWPAVGLGGMVTIAVLGAALTGRQLGQAAKAIAAGASTLTPELTAQLRHPILLLSARLRAALALGVVFLMCTKPALVGSLTTMAAAITIGAVAGARAYPAHAALSRSL